MSVISINAFWSSRLSIFSIMWTNESLKLLKWFSSYKEIHECTMLIFDSADAKAVNYEFEDNTYFQELELEIRF